MPRTPDRERKRRSRERRRRGQSVAKVRLDRVEMKKLAALGYLPSAFVLAERGAEVDAAVEAFVSDKLAEGNLAGRP